MSAAVDSAYRRYPKRVRFHARIDAGGAALKLYRLTAGAWGRYLASPRDDAARSRLA